jgi:hypothetical protein
MALILKDRVQETSTTTGTGTLTLAGAVTQFQTFSAAIGNGNTTYYTIYNAGGSDWEVGIGTVGAGTLSRDTVLASSNSGSLVSFTGTLYVFCDYPAGKASYLDVNGNVNANAFLNTLQTIAATGGTTTLTVSSPLDYLVTGSGGQTIKLPDATTLVNGTAYTFNNNQSSGAITVNNNSNTLIASIPSGGYVSVTLLSNATSAGSWDRHDLSPSNVSWSTNTLDYPGSITSATWNGNNIALNRGGTNASLTASAGSVTYSTASALALSAVGTSGQVLTSAGTGAPTWTTPTTGTVTSVTGTSPVVSSGGNTPAISMPAATGSVNGYLTSTDWTTFNNKGSGTVTSVAALTLGTTGTDLSSTVATGTTTPVITLNVPTASATNRGVLSSADWTTFNGKGSGTVTSVSVVSANGFAGTVATSTTTPAITLTTSITGLLKGNATAISAATSGTDYSAGTSALTTGILKSTTTTGALTIAVAADFPTLNQNTTGTAANVTGIVAIANGGTNSTATATAGGVGYGTGTAHAYTAAGTTGQVLTSNGSSAPTWAAASGGATIGLVRAISINCILP